MSRLTVADPRSAARVLFQALRATLERPDMAPRPLLTAQVVPGASEFAVSLSNPPTSQPKVGGGLMRRTYGGYVSLHFDPSINPGDGMDEDALIAAVLERTGSLLASHPSPGVTFAGLDGIDGDLFINTLPVEEGIGAAVLTLTVTFNLTLDLKVEIV